MTVIGLHDPRNQVEALNASCIELRKTSGKRNELHDFHRCEIRGERIDVLIALEPVVRRQSPHVAGVVEKTVAFCVRVATLKGPQALQAGKPWRDGLRLPFGPSKLAIAEAYGAGIGSVDMSAYLGTAPFPDFPDLTPGTPTPEPTPVPTPVPTPAPDPTILPSVMPTDPLPYSGDGIRIYGDTPMLLRPRVDGKPG